MNITNNSELSDQALSKRRQEIVGMAGGLAVPPRNITYLPHEHKIWQLVSTALRPVWEKTVANEVLEAREVIKLPVDFVPQLSDVSQRLLPVSGFTYRAVGGLVDKEDFFGALASKSFLSTQYLRHPKSPLYTPEPDIIHEVIGHGTCLADPKLAKLHQLAGEALVRVRSEKSKQFIANVWWFSGEFGVLRHSQGIKAYGAGLLSSLGELQSFTKKAQVREVNILEMGTVSYRIDDFQKVLFAVESVDHVLDEIGGFFAKANDAMIEEMLLRHDKTPL